MSIQKTLQNLKCIKKFGNLNLPTTTTHRKIADAIISSSSSPTPTESPAAVLSTLTPDIVKLILTDRRIKTPKCLSFFNVISQNRSLIPFTIEIEHYVTLIRRAIESRRLEEAETLISSLANDGNLRYPYSDVVSIAESQCFDSRLLSNMFNLMLKVYSDSGKFIAAFENFNYMRNNGIAIDERSCGFYLNALLRCEHSGLGNLGLVFFYKMVESGIGLSVVVDGLCQNGEIKRARQLVETVCRSVEPDSITFNTLVNACCERRNLKELDLVLLLMEKEGVELSLETYKILIGGFLSCRMLGDAERMIVEMHDKGLNVDIDLWNSIICKYCKPGRMESAFQVFDEMLQRGVAPNAETFRLMVSGICGIEEMDVTKELAKKMERKEIELGHDIFRDLINGCCKEEIVDAIELLSTMEKKIDNLPSTTQIAYQKMAELIISPTTQMSTTTKTTAALLCTLTPNIVKLVLSNRRIKTGRCLSFFNIISEYQSVIPFKIEIEHYLTLICRAIKSFKFEDAERLLDSLANEGNLRYPDVVSFAESQCLDSGILSKMFNLMLKVYSDSGKFIAAFENFNYMRNNGIAIDERTCSIYLIALLRCEHLVSGLVFFYKMMESGIDVSVYSLTIVIDGLCKYGEIKRARELVEAVCKNIEPNVITFNTLVDACCKRWNFRELDLVLNLMEKKGVEINLETHKFLIDGYLSSGKLGDAENTIMKMHDKDLNVETYLWNSIIFKHCKLGRMESAFQMFDKMLQRGAVPNAETFRIMVSGICGIGEMEAAKELANKMQRKEIELGHDVFDDLINGCCKKGMLDDAVGLLSMMEKKGLFGDARLYNMVIVGLCELDRVEEASRLLSIVVKCGATPETSFIQYLANS